ncbi:MAG: class I SAM-dependent methyltransferase, partial [Sphingomonadaceae bacterium]|nr:class I SAM-dependent methyltransferase [Sphingomonadaceae bacterium]
MNAPDTKRGRHLTRATGLRAVTGGLFARGFRTILDRIDRGLEQGGIEGRLPDGTTCMLGGRGPGPTAVVTLHSWKALLRLVRGGSTGWYEAWAAGEWSSPDPVPLFDLFMRNRVSLGTVGRPSGLAKLVGSAIHALRRNSRGGARRNIEFHYDLGNDFYSAWLDESMTYSCAIFAEPVSEAETLEHAQRRKVDRLLDRLQLKQGETLLEIGCGWGSLAEVALRDKSVSYHGITLSSEQKAYADRRLAGLGGASVTLTDYRDVTGKYDAIASVEMVEAVGQQYWPDYLACISRCLKPGGRAALQYIRIEDDIFESYAKGADFIQHYIFPGGMLLSESRFRAIANDNGLIWHDPQDFGPHYAAQLKRRRVRMCASGCASPAATGWFC